LFSLVELEVIADRTIRFSSQLWPICFWITEKRWKKEKDTMAEESNALAWRAIRPGCTTTTRAVFSSKKLPPKLQTFHHISITSKH